MFRKNNVQHLQTEVAGLVFPNPAGVPFVIHKTRFSWLHRAPEAGFLVLTPPSHEEVLPWIKGLSGERESSILAVDIKTDIVRSFSLVYDFADFIIIDPDSDMGIDAVEWAQKANRLGTGEILLTSMDCDGTKAGYDLELTRAIADHVDIPVIASGGAGSREHFYDALTAGGADAVLAASLFHYKELEISELKEYLADRNVSVRK